MSRPHTITGIDIGNTQVKVAIAQIDRDALLQSIAGFRTDFIPLIISLIVLNYIISSLRWKSLLSIYPNSEKADGRYLIALYFVLLILGWYFLINNGRGSVVGNSPWQFINQNYLLVFFCLMILTGIILLAKYKSKTILWRGSIFG